MSKIFTTLAFLIALSAGVPAWSQQDQLTQQVAELPWQAYPSVGQIGSIAQISLKGDLLFLNPAGTSRFLELNGNPPRNNQYTFAPRSLKWFVICGFDPSGYVRDDETLDPDELFRALQQQNHAEIEERHRLNLPMARLDGWAVPPHYDLQTRRLEWGTRLVGSTGDITDNYSIRILGRSGVMSMVLVSDPSDLDANIQQFHAAVLGFHYVNGERYIEFRQGDNIAAYGLGALIIGGAAAAAASSGMLKGLGKIIGVVVLAGVAAVGYPSAGGRLVRVKG